ncbi:cytosine permease [Peptococcaceae bacterium CEB3]|nr:cytosine permease [Peptococcaceae bacterium CEB3]
MSAIESGYTDKVLTVEPYGIEPIPLAERHGKSGQVFTFWFSANLNILTWFTGTLGIVLGLSFVESVLAMLVGNILGTIFLAVTSGQGPLHGLPQIAASGRVFGRTGLKIFGSVTWLSNVGWFAVDIVLGVMALQKIWGFSYLEGLLLLGLLTIFVAVIGYNFIHRFAQLTTIVLGLFFLVMTIKIVPQLSLTHLLAPSQLTAAQSWPLLALVAAAVFAYQIAFAAVGSDYSRYLPPSASGRKVTLLTFFGSITSGLWLEILGAAVTSLNPQAQPLSLIVQLMGLLTLPALLTIAVSTIPVNVLAIYSGGIALLAAGIPLKRWLSALLTGGLGILLIASGSGSFSDIYKNFLLLLSYWITPWIGIFLSSRPFSGQPRLGPRRALTLYFVALVLSVPFMSSPLFTGYVAQRFLGNADASYLISLCAAVLGVRLLSRKEPVNAERKR